MTQFTIRKRVVYELVQKKNKKHNWSSRATVVKKTPPAVAKSLAWRRISAKYGYLGGIEDLYGMECECSMDDNGYGVQHCTDMCAIHCKQYGYFAKLAKRYAAIIERAIIENDVSDEDFSVVLEIE